jgi:hypothetical protein
LILTITSFHSLLASRSMSRWRMTVWYWW